MATHHHTTLVRRSQPLLLLLLTRRPDVRGGQPPTGAGAGLGVGLGVGFGVVVVAVIPRGLGVGRAVGRRGWQEARTTIGRKDRRGGVREAWQHRPSLLACLPATDVHQHPKVTIYLPPWERTTAAGGGHRPSPPRHRPPRSPRPSAPQQAARVRDRPCTRPWGHSNESGVVALKIPMATDFSLQKAPILYGSAFVTMT